MKRKIWGVAAVLLIGTVIMLEAQTQERGGFTGPGLQQVTVREARSLWDDTPVVIRGNIIRYLGDEDYLFADDTGTIIVEIDDRLWRDFSVSENDRVEINGEVDRGFNRVKIEANSIRKL